LLKRIFVPSTQEYYHRQVVRRRLGLIGDRIRVQIRIKSELGFYGIDLLDEVAFKIEIIEKSGEVTSPHP